MSENVYDDGREIRDEEWADLFVAFEIEHLSRRDVFVTSMGLAMMGSLETFWACVTEAVWIDLLSWCEERGMKSEVAGTLVPALYQIDAKQGFLAPITDEKKFAAIREATDREVKRFAFMDERASPECLRAIAKLYEEVQQKKLPRGLKFA